MLAGVQLGRRDDKAHVRAALTELYNMLVKRTIRRSSSNGCVEF